MKARGRAGYTGFAQFAREIASRTVPQRITSMRPFLQIALFSTGQVNARKARRAFRVSISPTGRDYQVGHGQFRVPRRRERIYHIKAIESTGGAHFVD